VLASVKALRLKQLLIGLLSGSFVLVHNPAQEAKAELTKLPTTTLESRLGSATQQSP
jgi:hypothetical protein